MKCRTFKNYLMFGSLILTLHHVFTYMHLQAIGNYFLMAIKHISAISTMFEIYHWVLGGLLSKKHDAFTTNWHKSPMKWMRRKAYQTPLMTWCQPQAPLQIAALAPAKRTWTTALIVLNLPNLLLLKKNLMICMYQVGVKVKLLARQRLCMKQHNLVMFIRFWNS